MGGPPENDCPEGDASGDCVSLSSGTSHLYDCESPNELFQSELCHRVKNNLAMVVSMLGMQARGAKDEDTADQLREAAHRVDVVCSLYDQLSRGAAPVVSAAAYLRRLGATLAATLSLPVKTIVVSVSAVEVPLPSSFAANMGLIVNELVTNAYKHAAPASGTCEVDVSLSREADVLCLKVEDNGPGLPPGFNETGPGLGMKLVCGLVSQHGGTVSWSAGPGARAVVTLPVPRQAAASGEQESGARPV